MPDAFSWSLPWLDTAVALLFGYLLGSIPFGLILPRLFGLGDVRAIGSGNIGATNVLRTGNRAVAAATLAGDVLKGTLAVILAREWATEAALAAGLGAFLGHLFPVWLRFRGGKGVATYIGVLLGLMWPAALAFCAIWLAVALITRLSSLSALMASLATPLVLVALGTPRIAALLAIMTALVLIKHQANIERLINGTESRISFGAKGPPDGR